MKKIAWFLLLILTLTAASCSGEAGDASVTTARSAESSGTETTALSDGLPEANYEGYAFRMLMRNDEGWISDMYAETENGDTMNDAVYARNRAVEERFNIAIELKRSSNSNYETDGIKPILAGDDAYDIILPHGRAAFIYAIEHTLLDWKTELPNVDLTRPWWDANVAESFSIAGKLYTMTGDISYRNLGSTFAMVFNKKLMSDLKTEYPYQLVSGGEWTFDKFSEYVKKSTRDLNGDSVIDYTNDQVGYLTLEWYGPIQCIYSGGQTILSKDKDDLPVLSLNTPKTVEIYDKYFKLLNSNDSACVAWQEIDTSIVSEDSIYRRFSENKAMFLNFSLRNVVSLRDMDADFGLIPWPKFYEDIEGYNGIVDAGCHLIIVPITVSDAVRVSTVLEAMCFESYATVTPQYYDVVLSTKFTRDKESVDMLDIIKAGRMYDLGYYENNLNEFNSIGRDMWFKKNYNFSSIYAAGEASANGKIQKIITAYTK